MTTDAIHMRKLPSGHILLASHTWPPYAEILSDMLELGSPHVECDEDGYILFSVANGCAAYSIVGMLGVMGTSKIYQCRLVRGFVGLDL